MLTKATKAMKQMAPVELSKREVQIIKLLCKQLSTKEIGEKIGLKDRTVEDYRSNLLQKTKSRNTVGIVLFAIRNGIFFP